MGTSLSSYIQVPPRDFKINSVSYLRINFVELDGVVLFKLDITTDHKAGVYNSAKWGLTKFRELFTVIPCRAKILNVYNIVVQAPFTLCIFTLVNCKNV